MYSSLHKNVLALFPHFFPFLIQSSFLLDSHVKLTIILAVQMMRDIYLLVVYFTMYLEFTFFFILILLVPFKFHVNSTKKLLRLGYQINHLNAKEKNMNVFK